jgi:hypothetical protein
MLKTRSGFDRGKVPKGKGARERKGARHLGIDVLVSDSSPVSTVSANGEITTKS